MINKSVLRYLTFTLLVNPLRGGLHSFCGTWLRCNSLEWNNHSASLRLALHPKKLVLHPVQPSDLGSLILLLSLPEFCLVKHSLDKFRCHERPQIIYALAHSYEADRQWRFLLALPGDCGNDTPLGGTVEFGDDKASQAKRVIKSVHLIDGILPSVGVEHQQRFMGRTRLSLGNDSLYLFKLIHQV